MLTRIPMTETERDAADLALRRAFLAHLLETLRAKGITPDHAGRLKRDDAAAVRKTYLPPRGKRAQ